MFLVQEDITNTVLHECIVMDQSSVYAFANLRIIQPQPSMRRQLCAKELDISRISSFGLKNERDHGLAAVVSSANPSL